MSMNTHAPPSRSHSEQSEAVPGRLVNASLVFHTVTNYTWTLDYIRTTHSHTNGRYVRDEGLATEHQAVVEDTHSEDRDARLFDQHGTGAQEQGER